MHFMEIVFAHIGDGHSSTGVPEISNVFHAHETFGNFKKLLNFVHRRQELRNLEQQQQQIW